MKQKRMVKAFLIIFGISSVFIFILGVTYENGDKMAINLFTEEQLVLLDSISSRYESIDDLHKVMPAEVKELGLHNDVYWYHTSRSTGSNGKITPKSTGYKLIYGATHSYLMTWEEMLTFENCPYSNCKVVGSLTHTFIEQADVVLYYFREIKRYPKLHPLKRSNQIWVLYTDESNAYEYNEFLPAFNGIFNATMTYRRDSDIVYPFGKADKTKENMVKSPATNYAEGKTKGAYVYVTNCHSQDYDRLATIKMLQNYINVDIFGACSGIFPCDRSDTECEKTLHSKYRFYLSFENSMCKDYITEKFWSRLASDGHFIPVALGGLSIEDYMEVAPPDSFIHVYNFTSMDSLGKYLQHLMTDDEAYNRYHAWRPNYKIETFGYISSCKLCELANNKPSMPAKQVSTWWNQKSLCRTLNI